MLKPKNVLSAAVALTVCVLLVGFFTTFGVNSQVGQSNNQPKQILRPINPNRPIPQKIMPTEKELDDLATPIADFDAPATVNNEKRKGNNKRFDNGDVTGEASPRNTEVIVHSESSMPDFPFKISDLVVEGTITGSNAFLSEDKTGVYSEYGIKISDIIKNSASVPVNKHDLITGERFGGRVRYPSGQIVRYKAAEQGSPVVNEKYLFFLRKTAGDNFLILTAYQMQGNKVFALDGSRISGYKNGQSVFDKHNGQDAESFKKEVENAKKGEANEVYKVY